MSTLNGVAYLALGESTLDSNNGRYFNITNLGITIVDLENGSIIETISNGRNMKGLQYDNSSGRLYGSYWDKTQEKEMFGYLDLSTKNFKTMSTLNGVAFLALGQSTLDSNNGRYFNITNLGITIVDIENGSIIETISNGRNIKGIEF
jgi:uncharacterized membrane protein